MASDSRGIQSFEALRIDQIYEFSAPRFFDFINNESEEEAQKAELWFEMALTYAPSTCMPKIKMSRSVHPVSLRGFRVEEQYSDVACDLNNPTLASDDTRHVATEESHKCEEKHMESLIKVNSTAKPCTDHSTPQQNRRFMLGKPRGEATSSVVLEPSPSRVHIIQDTCIPKSQIISAKGEGLRTSSKNQTTKKIPTSSRKPSAVEPKNQSILTSANTFKPISTTRCPDSIPAKNNIIKPEISQENQPIKRQKLENGRSRQVLDVKDRILLHKSKRGLSSGTTNLSATTIKGCRGERNASSLIRKVYVRESATPFISTAEMVRRFESKTRELEQSHNRSLSHDETSLKVQRKHKLTLTRPKEPELETAHRARPAMVKSSADLEEEMLANLPRFKARAVNKKIFEAPSIPMMPRSTPRLPEFKEFHLKTMERANQHVSASSHFSSSIDSSCQKENKSHHKLTEPRTPHLETSLRARPTNIKSSQELELEELEKVKFKARPLNKKILESRGELGLFCIPKRQLTTPHEFHFATNERIPPAKEVTDLFDKLSLGSKACHDEQTPRITAPTPFHLRTEERGLEKQKTFEIEVLQQQLEEHRARIPKARPYPCSTDYPVIPPKPTPKKCTKPEAFPLESLVRHEEEMQKKMEERERIEKEEEQMRIFRAKPIQKDDPFPVSEKARKPLTQIQEFVLHVDHRPIDREEFDKKIKEKELMCKRYREECEAAKMMEEEKAVKQMRRTMVPHVRPLPRFYNRSLQQKC